MTSLCHQPNYSIIGSLNGELNFIKYFFLKESANSSSEKF